MTVAIPDIGYAAEGRATQNADAERALLCAVLSGHPAAAESLPLVAARDFYQPRNAAVWEACQVVAGRGERIDSRTLPVPAKARPYLVELVTADAEPLHASRYAALVVDAAMRRRLVEASIAIRQRAEDADDANTAAQDARQIIDEAAENVTDEDSGVGAAALVQETIDGLENGDERKIFTGWSDLDDFADGMRPGQLVVVGARPGFGKSVVAANIAAAVCQAGIGVHFASLEMPRREVMARLMANHCTVNLTRLLNSNKMTEDDWSRLAHRSGDIAQWPLHVDDQSAQSLNQIRARARSTARRMELGLIIVDYLQIMSPSSRKVSREQQVGDLSEGLKNLARDLEVPVVALSQINRGPADRRDPRPTMSDLRESGRIEADADQVLLLHRPDLCGENPDNPILEVNVAKNRNGPTGRTVELAFQGNYSRAALRAWTPTRSLS